MEPNRTMQTGIFVGSFDPFTIGHASIVERILPLFRKIVIGVSAQQRRKYLLPVGKRVENIRVLYEKEPKVEVKSYDDLTVNFARRENASFIIRGVRSVNDFEYERVQADLNKQIGGIETIFLFAEPQLGSVSSTAVRELLRYNESADQFIPKAKNTTE